MMRLKYRFGVCRSLGGGAKCSKNAASQVGNMVTTWRCAATLAKQLSKRRHDPDNPDSRSN